MIIKSEIVDVSTPQIDGRLWVTERHYKDDGEYVQFMTLYDPDTDYVSIMNTRAANMNQQEQENNQQQQDNLNNG